MINSSSPTKRQHRKWKTLQTVNQNSADRVNSRELRFSPVWAIQNVSANDQRNMPQLGILRSGWERVEIGEGIQKVAINERRKGV